LDTVLCLGKGHDGDLDFARAAATPAGALTACTSEAGDPFILLYTSGTTGKPKGVPVPVRALASFHAYLRWGLDLRPGDVFWNVSDPGWGYGLWFGVVGPLLLGHATILRGVPFDAADSLRALERLGVTNLTGAPTFYRSLRDHGVDEHFRDRTALRAVSSAGEPLGPELLSWSREALGVAIHDHYGQSEIGMAIGFPHHPGAALPPEPASMGKPFPGYRTVILDADGTEARPGAVGELAIDTERSALYWFPGYYRAPGKTEERFPAGQRYYVTGDTAMLLADGTFGSASRADDVITSSGYRIGPFDVETVLLTHQDVAQAAVFGLPDPLRGEIVTAAIVPRKDVPPSANLRAELRELVRERLGRHLYPRRIHFVAELPRTPSGKVQRHVLRATPWPEDG
jgi:acetyl-CoA synthetase